MVTTLRLGTVCLLALTLLLLSSCIGATRMVTRQRGPGGQPLEVRTLDLSFVQPGTTTRDEVLAKLSIVNTGYDDPHFFWGRWATSKWGYWYAVAGNGAGAADANRVWHVRNLLVTFDDDGVTQKLQVLDDGPPLWRELNKYVATLPATDFAKPLLLRWDGYSSQLIALTSEWVNIELHYGRKKSKSARVSPDRIIRMTNSGPKDKRNSPGTTCHVLYLSEDTELGKKLPFCTDGPGLMEALRYLHRYGSSNMRWE